MRNFGILVFIATVFGLPSGFAAFAAERDNAASGQRQTLIHNGIKRSYVIRAPREPAQRGGRMPLVLVLHGGGGNADNAESMTGFTEKAASEGFIVVYPEGTGRFKGKLLTWNAGHCCGYAMDNQVHDVEFINALLDKLIVDYPVDPKRIYATGLSNGGMMTHRLGIELSNRFAAIAPVVATFLEMKISRRIQYQPSCLTGCWISPFPVRADLPVGVSPTLGTVRRPSPFWSKPRSGLTRTAAPIFPTSAIAPRLLCGNIAARQAGPSSFIW